jgi:galactonate dehydratase
MKITAVRTTIVPMDFRNGVYTFVETDAGLTGVSEVVMRRKSRTVEEHIHELERFLIGRDPTRIEDAFEKMYRDSFWVGGPMHATALSAVEIALWDIFGKSLNVPVYKLLGGPCRDEILVYCHVQAGASPDDFAANALAARDRGFRAFKTTLPVLYGMDKNIRWYSGLADAASRSLKETEYLPTSFFARVAEFFAAARQAVGNEMEMAVDCHGRLSPANAVRLCEALAPHKLMFVEEPVPPENADALAFVIRRSPIPIASGERLATIYEARPFLQEPGLAMLQCDVVNCGGISQMKKIAAMAEANYVGIAPHNPNGPLATAASVQVCAAISNFTILETIGSAEEEALAAKILRNPLKITDGVIRIPQGPGLGVDVNEEFINQQQQRPYHPYDGWR